MGSGARSSARNFALNIALGLVALLISLVAGEIALRMLGYEPRRLEPDVHQAWAAEDDALGWVNRPGTSHSAEPGHVAMRFESDGRRSDPAGNKPENLPRVLVVGCSLTQGYGVADDETYAHFVNRSLSSAELLNYGTGGYGTYQSLLRIKSYFRSARAPTPLVLYGFYESHIFRNPAPLDWILHLTTRDGRYMVPPNVRMRSGRFVEDRGGPVELWPLELRSAAVALAHRVIVRRLYRESLEAADDVFRHVLAEMHQTVADKRASLLVVGLTKLPGWAPAWMREQGIDYIECAPANLWEDPTFRVGGVGHPNARAHRWWADCLLRALAKRGFTGNY
jgi:hypothetical protein